MTKENPQAEKRPLRSEKRPTDKTNNFRIRLTPDEMDVFTMKMEAAGFLHQGRYARHVLFEEEAPSAPDFGSAKSNPVAARPIRLRVRLSMTDDERLNELAAAAGTESEQYARWRLVGNVQ